jgi:hypothetical protein
MRRLGLPLPPNPPVLPCLHPTHAGWYSIRAILWAYDWQAPTAVAAHAGAAFSEDGVPLHLGATLLFPGGRRGNFECGGWPPTAAAAV